MLRKACQFIFTLLLTTPALASSNVNFLTYLASSWVISLSGGLIHEQAGKTQTLNLAPQILKTYTANNEADILTEGEIFLGIHHPLPYAQSQFGLAAAATNNATLSGNIWDDADPEFNNYTYQYKVSHRHIALKGKLISDCDWPFLPWVSASMGIAFNRAYDFTNTPIIFEAIQNPNFNNHTNTSFTYALGIGIQRKLTPKAQIGIAYEFADWGKTQLGTAPGQTEGHGLTLSHFYTNGVMLNFTYTA